MAARAFSRWRASGLHLAISAAVAAGSLALILGLWFPGPLFEAAGGLGLLYLLVGVDVVLGPLLTMIVFKPGKPGLKLDVAVIGTLRSPRSPTDFPWSRSCARRSSSSSSTASSW